ncbi:PhaM family polyhydroxyalkanoate granule multifunctional regulatory protein [Mycetohabitans sp. B46]|uniref:PhaM family polyhydroxyalkanoate granule multifunctional regulatory protein n=1 Tax=Mycetohabitans sp. B46 TaxID=2772536 RepID=UPI00307E0BAC
MSDSSGNTPFSSFPRFSPNTGDEMLDSLLKLMRVEELDKRITDLRTVEQWLKLNLSMLQSTIQALQVQRSTLATLHAFGAFAQASMTPTPGGASGASRPSGESGISGDVRGAPWPPTAAADEADGAEGAEGAEGADDARRTAPHAASAADGPPKQAAAVDPFAFARAFYDVARGTVTGAREGAAGATGPADAAQSAAGEASPQWDTAAHGTQAVQAGEPVAGQQGGPDAQDGAPAERRAPDTSWGEAAAAAPAADAGECAAASRADEPLDASAWWSWLQTQFEQIARFAVAPHTMPGVSVPADDIEEAMRQRGDAGLGRSSPDASVGVGRSAAKARSSTAARAPSKRAAVASGSATQGEAMAESGMALSGTLSGSGTSTLAGKAARHSGSAEAQRPGEARPARCEGQSCDAQQAGDGDGSQRRHPW